MGPKEKFWSVRFLFQKSFGSKNILKVSTNLGQKKIWSPKFWGVKKKDKYFWVQEIVVPKKTFV